MHRLRHPADPDRPGDRRSSRPTRPASARARSRPSCSTTSASSCARPAREYGTTTGRPRRCGWYDAVDRPLRRPGQRRHRLRAHQARRAHRAGDRSRSASPTTSTASATTRCRSTRPTSTTPCRSTRTSPAGGRTSPARARSTTCRPNAQAYVKARRGDVGRPDLGDRRRPRPPRDRRGPRPPLDHGDPDRVATVKVLVIGNGGREHALARRSPATRRSRRCTRRPATRASPRSRSSIPSTRSTRMRSRDLAIELEVDLVVVGPEAPLVAGVADVVRRRGIDCFGPGRDAAQIEGSKAFAKDVMAAAGVPTAMARVCETESEAADGARCLRDAVRREGRRACRWQGRDRDR